MPEDIRWKQRFDNYVKALQTLSDAVELAQKRALSMLEEQGVIQSFEFTHELAWNVLKDYLEYQGVRDIIGSRGAVREAFKNGLIEDGETWMTMIRDRICRFTIFKLSSYGAISWPKDPSGATRRSEKGGSLSHSV